MKTSHGSLTHLHFNMSYVVEKRYLFCSSNLTVPRIILTCLLPAFYPQCTSLSNLFLSEILLPVSLENFCCIFFHFETYPFARFLLYFHIVYKGWAKKRVLETFDICRKGRTMRKAPLPNGPHFAQAGLQEGFLFSFHCMFPSSLVHSH